MHCAWTIKTKKFFFRPQRVQVICNEKCFSALSPFSTSWVHWLFEVYPQLIELSKLPDGDVIKILLEEEAPPQIYATVAALFPIENIIKIPYQNHVFCKKLLVYTALGQGWSVLWGRDVKDKLVEKYYHNIEAFKSIRAYAHAKFGIDDKKDAKENIFIRRKANFRFIHNEQELADSLTARGFKTIEPSNMSFQEQVECFNNAKIVVAQAGASLANIIFMRPGSSVICMAADSTFLNYDYFRSIAESLGVSLKYVLGKVDNEKKYFYKEQLSTRHPLNASFTIDKNKLHAALLEI